jgi:hypothetical protein
MDMLALWYVAHYYRLLTRINNYLRKNILHPMAPCLSNSPGQMARHFQLVT